MPLKDNKQLQEYHKSYYKKNKDRILKRQKLYSDKNKEKVLSYGRNYYYDNKEKLRIGMIVLRQNHRERYLLRGYKYCDKKKNLENDLTIEWLLENILNKSCIYCNSTQDIGCDRIDNNIGHIKSNCVPCCYSCNIMRGNRFSYDEMLFLSPSIKEIMKRRTVK